MTQRFYFSRRKDGSYHIIDRYIDLRIAKAEFREAAVQIITALNMANHSNACVVDVALSRISK